MKTRKRVATLFILGALLLSTVTPVLGAPSLNGDLTPSIAFQAPGCDQFQVEFTGSATGGQGDYTYEWDFGDGEDPGTGQVVIHTYGDAGTYTVTLKVTDSAETTAKASESVTIKENPKAKATADPTLAKPGEPIDFSGTATGGKPAYTFAWAFGDGDTGTGPTATHVYTDTAFYDVTLTVTDANECTAQDTVRVAVGEPSEHIISNLIAAFFIVPPEYIDALRAMGWGYGEIAKAYFLAQLSGEHDIEDIIAMRGEGKDGSGWGQIMKEVLDSAGLHGYNLGLIMSGREAPAHLQNLADSCGMEVESVSELLRESGGKSGTVRRACRLAQQAEGEGFTAESIVEMRQRGKSWREIEVALGLVAERGPKEEGSQGQGHGKGHEGQGSQGQGHAQGKGKGKGPKH